jgi:hypothetical protein
MELAAVGVLNIGLLEAGIYRFASIESRSVGFHSVGYCFGTNTGSGFGAEKF